MYNEYIQDVGSRLRDVKDARSQVDSFGSYLDFLKVVGEQAKDNGDDVKN